MTEPTKKVFSTAVGGYSRTEVDEYINWLRKTMSELESYNSLAVREQNSLRERVVQLEESLKLVKSPGYAHIGAQFEQTLRLAESEAAKLVNDAGKEAVRIRETAKAEAERIRFEAEEFAKPIVDGANREARRLVMQSRKQSEEILEQAQDELRQVQAERAQLQKEANVIKSEADNHVAQVKAELQTEVERIQTENARLLKRNADIEAEIRTKIDDGEKQALELFRKIQRESQEMHDQAERELRAATAEAASLIENAELTLENARKEADRIAQESQSMAAALLADARARAEKLAVRSLDITREAIAEAEYRLAKLPSQQNSIQDFLSETRSMLTPEQEVLISRRKSLEQTNQPPLEAELIEDADETK